MKIYKPLFSLTIIFIQLILSIISYNEFVAWGEENPGLNGILTRFFLGDTLFLFVLIIGLYEMLTKPGWFKTAIKIFLVCIILGTQFGGFIPIDSFYYGVYNTAWFSAVVAILLILIRFGKYIIRKLNQSEKASR